MRTEDLKAFVTVAELGSFQLAAQRLFLSQPTISKRIASLETRLDQPLLDRLGRTVELTEAGRAYLPHARAILASLADGERALADLSERVDGPLSLTVSHHIGQHRLPPILRRFVAAYPDVDPCILFADSEEACDHVVNGISELGLVTLAEQPHATLISQTVWPDPLAVYVSSDHPIASSSPIPLASLAGWPAVLPPPNSYTYSIIEAAFGIHGVTIEARMTSHSLDTLRMLADVGLGWTVLPRSMPHALTRLTTAPVLTMQRELGVMRHPQRYLSNAARALMALLPTC